MKLLAYRKYFKFLLLPLVFLFVFVLYMNKAGEEQAAAEEIRLPVRVTAAVYGALEQELQVSGHIESEKMVTILPRVSGLLEALYVDIGDVVQTGQLLAEVDSESYHLQLRQAESAYLAAKSTFERTENLFASRATTQQNFDQAKGQYEAYKSQYELAKLQYQYTKLLSPLDGVVLQRHATVGSLVASQIPIVTIGDISTPVLRAKIPEFYYRRFSHGAEYIRILVYRPDDPHRIHNAKIKSVAPYVSAESRNFEVSCEIPEGAEDLRPGMFVFARFVLEESEELWSLPFEVQMANNTVWIIDEDSIARRLELPASVFSNQHRFSIPDEWQDYQFVIEGQHFLREGLAVTVMGTHE